MDCRITRIAVASIGKYSLRPRSVKYAGNVHTTRSYATRDWKRCLKPCCFGYYTNGIVTPWKRPAVMQAARMPIHRSHQCPCSRSTALASFLTVKSVQPSTFSITNPFSLAKCNKQINPNEVLMSDNCCRGYTCCRLFIMAVKVSVPSSSLGNTGIWGREGALSGLLRRTFR